MKKRIAPILEIQIDITQPTRCVVSCHFLLYTHPGKRCYLFNIRLREIRAKKHNIIYTHRCKQCREAEIII